MSVWKSATYKVANAQAMYATIPSCLELALGRDAGRYLKCAGDMCPIYPDDRWEDVASTLRWAPAAPDLWDSCDFDVSRVRRWNVGTVGIYKLIHSIHSGRFEVARSKHWDYVNDTLEYFANDVVLSTQVTPADFKKAFLRVDDVHNKLAEKFHDASAAFSKVLGMARRSKMAEIPQVSLFGTGKRFWYGVAGAGVVILRGAKEYVNQGIFLTKTHVALLAECLGRIACMFDYFATHHAGNVKVGHAFDKMFALQMAAIRRSKTESARSIARAFQKCKAYAQMLLFKNEQKGAISSAREDYVKDQLDHHIHLDAYMSCVTGLNPAYVPDILALHKWMPPPDFDVTAGFEELRSWHMKPRASALDVGATAEAKDLWAAIDAERKRNLANAYHNIHNHWPNKLTVRGRAPTNEELAQWDYTGCLPYAQVGKDVSGFIADKTTVSPSLKQEVAKPGKDASYLMWYMRNRDMIDLRADLKDFHDGAFSEDNYCRVAYKPEAHKLDGRLFFIAPPRTRLLLGEFEGNLAKIAGNYPGSLQGRSAAEKARMVREVMDVHTDPVGADVEADYGVYIVTFDLSKFSPKSNAAVTQDYHEFWARAFGKPELASLGRIGTTATILHTTNGIKMQYKNQGADLEGFRGRMQTMFHVDLLAAACRLANKQGHITGKAHLNCFIDDGAVKVAATGNGFDCRESINAFLKCMQDVYAAAGQENHPDKTIISRVGGELLAEQYYLGKKLPAGVKAAMRLLPDYENPACAITEEIDGMFAVAQGAVKDGMAWVPAYRAYVRAAILTIIRWYNQVRIVCSADKLSLKLITPKPFGGFGIQPLQGLVGTAAGNLTAEGLGMLNRLARGNPVRAKQVKAILGKPVLPRDPVAVLRDPNRIRLATPVLAENRLTMAVIRWLSDHGEELAATMKAYVSEEVRNHATQLAEAILQGDQVSVPFLVRAWKSTPLYFIESIVGKFKRAASIISMLGYSTIGKIRRANMSELIQVLTS